MELAICGIVYGVKKKMMIFVVLAIVFAVLSVFLYKAEHNFRADGFCEGTISRIILEDSGDMRYYIKAYINGIEREGETYTYEKSPKKTYVGQKVKVEYFVAKMDSSDFALWRMDSLNELPKVHICFWEGFHLQVL